MGFENRDSGFKKIGRVRVGVGVGVGLGKTTQSSPTKLRGLVTYIRLRHATKGAFTLKIYARGSKTSARLVVDKKPFDRVVFFSILAFKK